MVINNDAKKKATDAIQHARKIDEDFKEMGVERITIEVIDTPEFWAGVNLLTTGEYKLLPGTDSKRITLERRKP